MTTDTSGQDRVRIVVVDDDEIVRKNLVEYLAHAPEFEIVGMGATGFEAIRLAADLKPDILMSDIRMPVMDGVTAAEQVRFHSPNTRVVLLTTFDDDEVMLAGLRAGAAGFLLKSTSPEELINGLRQVVDGGTIVSPGPTSRLVRDYLVQPAPTEMPELQLSPREHEVLELLCQAYSNQEIAEKLFVRESTVKSHVSSIMTKLEVNTRLKIVVRAYELGLVRH